MGDRNYSTETWMPLEQALILVVEDELILAEDIRNNLIALGYRVPEAVVSGEEAVRQAEEMRPDLVLMDIKLQGEVDGIQAAEQIQRLDIPVIFITAFSDDVTLQRSKIAGPFGYIIKPVETRELHVAVEIALYRHQLETRLKENERWLDTTLRSIGDGVIATDAVGRVTFMNPVAEELTGWKQADAVGHDLTEVFHIVNEVTKEPVENPVTRVLQEGAIVGLANHTLLIRKDGSEIPIDDSGAPIRDDNGIITGVVLVFRDVTERVRAEVVRRQAEGALKTAKEFAENLVETANTIIVTLDSEANITTFNRYAEQLTGYKKAEVIGRNWFDIFISQRDRENIPKVFSQALKNMPQASQYENSIVTKNGEERLISWSNNILRDSSGNITGVLSIGMDITERKQAEEERLAHLNFLQAMEQVTRAIQQTSDLEQVMKDVLETVLSIFQCDRAWLLYPCDPDAPSWRVPMECTRPEYPGALNMNVDYAMTSDVARDFQRLLDSEEPLTFAWNPGDAEFDPKDEFAIQSAIGMAIYPRTGQPWEFGLHQCSRTRTWTEREKRLFKGIGHRIADALSSLLFFQNLQRSEERYRTIFETAGVSIWEEDFSAIHAACKELQVQGVTDLRRYLDEHPEFVRQAAQMIKVVDVNETTVKMFGAASKADLLTSLDRIVVPETMDIFREEILAIAEGRTYFVGETVNQTLDGNRLNVLLTMRIPMEEEKLDRVLVSLTDITERKRMEEALRESEARYRLHFENVSDIIYSLDSEFRILDVSPSVERVLGYKPEELIGKSFQELNVLASEYLGQAFSDTMCVLAGERITSAVYQFIAQDGTKRWGEVSGAPLVRDGQVVALVSVARDITERKRIEKQLHQHERLAAVGQLAAGIAHDFRNMLTTIILYANMGLHKPDLPPNLAQNLETIIGESKKAADLVQQILDFSSRAMIQVQPLDLQTFVEEIVDILRRTIPENIRLVLEIGRQARAAPLIVEADPTRVQQALMNLATNARDAMPNGGELLFKLSRIKLEPGDELPVADMQPDEWICLAVSDTGVGMSEEVRAHLFEPFFTTKEVGKGTGLGLAQVYGIVRQHEGYVGVETEEGRGTTFRIYLPPATGVQVEIVEETVSAAPQGQGETILLVEDNEQLQEAGQEILESLGYQVLVAANGREALEIYRTKGGVDLVITDMVMPEMGGKELVQELRRTAPDLKAIGVTGYAADKVAVELLEAGFLDVIHKPFDVDTLTRVIRCVLDVG